MWVSCSTFCLQYTIEAIEQYTIEPVEAFEPVEAIEPVEAFEQYTIEAV